jgi:hypothetical protein
MVAMALCCCLGSCSERKHKIILSPDSPGFFIDRPGTWVTDADRTSIDVFRANDGTLDFKIWFKASRDSGYGAGPFPIAPNAPWFAYVKDSRTTWFFDGSGRLMELTLARQQCYELHTVSGCSPWLDLIQSVPSPVLNSLPMYLRERIQGRHQHHTHSPILDLFRQ